MTESRHHLVVDLEATCSDDESVPRGEMEIIEIGAVMADHRTLQPLGEFQAFVKPVRHPRLTHFCRQLTTIEQRDVDEAESFPTVLARFVVWANDFGSYLFGSWGTTTASSSNGTADITASPTPSTDT